jgi:hypothetical protein
VGYTIREAVRVEEGEKWQDPESGKIFPGPALVATRWEVYEISLTPTPADPSVGVGRDLTRDLTGIKFLSEEETLKMTRKLIPIDRLNEIFDRAKRVSPECLARVVDLAEAGAAEGELLTEILDAMGITAGAKARQNERRLSYRSFSEIPDDVLAFALKYPDSAPMSPATKSGRQPAAPPARRATLPKLSEISDEAFAEAFKNPFYLY